MNHLDGIQKDEKTGKQLKVLSTCHKVKRCKSCGKLLQLRHDAKHKCGFFQCRVCKLYDDIHNNECWMQPIIAPHVFENIENMKKVKKKKHKKKKQHNEPFFIFFDFETLQDEPLLNNTFVVFFV